MRSRGGGRTAPAWSSRAASIARAANEAAPGTAIRIHAGTYSGGTFLYDLTGTPSRPIWISTSGFAFSGPGSWTDALVVVVWAVIVQPPIRPRLRPPGIG